MSSKGIDYGFGKTNIDKKTGIRFGVISLNALCDFAIESFRAYYGDPTCPFCGGKVRQSRKKDYYCQRCKKYYYSQDCFPEEPLEQTLNEQGYEGILDSHNDVFLTKSPYFTLCGFCSTCAPGAGDLSSYCEDGAKTYCFGHDWFANGKAPYPVFRLPNGERVLPCESNESSSTS